MIVTELTSEDAPYIHADVGRDLAYSSLVTWEWEGAILWGFNRRWA